MTEEERIGRTTGTPVDNLLIQGDGYHALQSLTRIPEYSEQYKGKVKLVYIDPPFNTGQIFGDHYDDNFEHSIWLSLFRDRLKLIFDLLSADGSVWVHLDDSEAHRARMIMDRVFEPKNFVAQVVWQGATGTRQTAIAGVHDYILVYARNADGFANARNGLPRTDVQLGRFKNPDNDPRGPWRQGGDSQAPGSGTNYPIVLPSGRVVRPNRNSHWRFGEQKFREALADGRVYFGKDGNALPIVKKYLSEVAQSVTPSTWWSADEVGSNQEAKRDHLNLDPPV